MNIVILNWRDIKNPASGGAEYLTHELAKSWVTSGEKVVIYTSAFPNCLKEEDIDGVHVIRKGLWWNTHVFAFFYYLHNRNTIDVIIDEVHWFPYFAKIYAPGKTILLACEVATNLFQYLFPPVIATVFKFVESLYLSIYKDGKVLTISNSTKEDLLQNGFISEKIHVMNLGIQANKIAIRQTKKQHPILISIGRLTRLKGIVDIVKAFAIVHKKHKNLSLLIVGRGDSAYVDELKLLAKSLHVQKNIQFYGFVSESKKYELLSRSTIHVMASVQEGWGLTVSEAFLCRTPTVAYNSNGLRDVISHKNTGILTDRSPIALAAGIEALLTDKKSYAQIQNKAFDKASKFKWSDTADKALKFIMN